MPAAPVIAARDAPHLFAASSRSAAPSTTSSAHIVGGSPPAAGCGRRSGSRSSPTTCGATARALYAADGRRHHADHRPVGHRQGAGRAGHRPVALHPVRPRGPAFADDSAESFYRAEPLGAVADADRVGAVRPPAGRFTGALEDRTGWLEVVPAARHRLPRRDRRARPGHPGQAAARAADAHLPAPGRHRDAASGARSSPPPTATWRAEIAGRPLPRGPLLPPLLGPDHHAVAATSSSAPPPASWRTSCASSAAAWRATRRRSSWPRRARRWIDAHLGADYAWPGNFRELEQCVRNVMIRGRVPPPAGGHPLGSPASGRRRARRLTDADEVLRRYCTLVYAQTGSYQETGRRLGLDRRTVREKIDAPCSPSCGASPEPRNRVSSSVGARRHRRAGTAPG